MKMSISEYCAPLQCGGAKIKKRKERKGKENIFDELAMAQFV